MMKVSKIIISGYNRKYGSLNEHWEGLLKTYNLHQFPFKIHRTKLLGNDNEQCLHVI